MRIIKSIVWLAITTFLSTAAAKDDSEAAGQFFSPPDADDGTHDYTTNPVYVLGQKQTIKYTTVYQNYKIDLWQQHPNQNAARLGPTVFQTTGGAVTQFDWTVQAYQFDLSYSEVFFLWLSSTSKSKDGSEPQSVTSHYFNITDDKDIPVSSSTTALPSSTTSHPPTTVSSTTIASTTAPNRSPDPPVLGTGAQAGIGVGAALAGLAAVFVAFLVYRRSRGKTRQQPSGENPDRGGYPHEAQQQMMHAQEIYKPPELPIEMGHQPVRGYYGHPVELPAER